MEFSAYDNGLGHPKYINFWPSIPYMLSNTQLEVVPPEKKFLSFFWIRIKSVKITLTFLKF